MSYRLSVNEENVTNSLQSALNQDTYFTEKKEDETLLQLALLPGRRF